jgi:hypothetical protein
VAANTAKSQADLTLEMTRGTVGAYVDIGNPPETSVDQNARMLWLWFNNRPGKLPATDFSVHMEIRCEILPKRTTFFTKDIDLGGTGTTLRSDGTPFYIKVHLPESCADSSPKSRSEVGIIRQGRITYLNGLKERQTEEFCDEYFQVHYPNGQGWATGDRWNPCANVSEILKNAIIPFDPR